MMGRKGEGTNPAKRIRGMESSHLCVASEEEVETRATIEVHHFFSEVPQFWS